MGCVVAPPTVYEHPVEPRLWWSWLTGLARTTTPGISEWSWRVIRERPHLDRPGTLIWRRPMVSECWRGLISPRPRSLATHRRSSSSMRRGRAACRGSRFPADLRRARPRPSRTRPSRPKPAASPSWRVAFQRTRGGGFAFRRVQFCKPLPAACLRLNRRCRPRCNLDRGRLFAGEISAAANLTGYARRVGVRDAQFTERAFTKLT